MGAAVELNALLARHHIDLTSEEVLGELDAAFAAIPRGGAATLSAPEADFLAEHGGPSAAAIVRGWSANGEHQSRARVALQGLTSAVAGSISAKEAAEILGVDRSRISRRIGKTLWAFDIHGQRRLPGWQFLDRILGRKPRTLVRGEPILFVAGRSPAVRVAGLGRRCIA